MADKHWYRNVLWFLYNIGLLKKEWSKEFIEYWKELNEKYVLKKRKKNGE